MSPDAKDHHLGTAALDAALELDNFCVGKPVKEGPYSSFDHAREASRLLRPYLEGMTATPGTVGPTRMLRASANERIFAEAVEKAFGTRPPCHEDTYWAVREIADKLEKADESMTKECAGRLRDFCLGVNSHMLARYHTEYEEDNRRRRRYA